MSISPITGYAAFASARIGSNGDPSDAAAECFAGVSDTSRASGRKVWCANTADPFDSGWVSVVWIATTAGGSGSIQFQVNGCSPSTISYAGTAGGGIDSVRLRAAVRGANRRTSFRNVIVEFYDLATDTDFTEQYTLATALWPVVDTTGQTNPVETENVRNVLPSGPDWGKIRVAADIRFECADAGLPAEDALFADMYIFT
jgi:hypothetical protein